MKHLFPKQLLLCCFLLLSRASFGQFYLQDSTFKPLPVMNAYAPGRQVIVQPDQKILINPGANYINDTEIRGLARLNPDGSLDAGFERAIAYAYYLNIALRPDGKILGAGLYTASTGRNHVYLRLFDGAGREDSTHFTDVPCDFPAQKGLALQPDGKILVGTNLFENGMYRAEVRRLTSRGSLDNAYNPGLGSPSWINEIIPLPDGKALLFGNFPDPVITFKSVLRLNADGSVDPGFSPEAAVAYQARTGVVQPDGKLLLTLAVTPGGTGQEGIVRLNPNGTRDQTFRVPASGYSISASALALQPNGKLLVAAWYPHPDHPGGRVRVIRLDGNGNLDNAFVPAEGADPLVTALTLQADGKVLVNGTFTRYDGQVRAGLLRLGSTGGLDAGFRAKLETSSQIWTIKKQPDGKLLVGGTFDVIGGQARKYLVRLRADGTVDASFNAGVAAFQGPNNFALAVRTIGLQADGKILAGGHFSTFDGQNTSGLVRLHADGRLSDVFPISTSPDYFVLAVVVQPDQKILVSGHNPSTPEPLKTLVRLLPDGRPDPGFAVGTGFRGQINTVVLQPDGKILVGGPITHFNDEPVENIVRLNADGTRDASFSPAATGIAVKQFVLQPDGKIILEGSYISIPVGTGGYVASKLARLHPDGRLDEAFNPTLGPYDNVEHMITQPGGRLLLSGGLLSYGRPLMLLDADGSVNKYFYPLFLDQVQRTTQVLSDGTDLFAGAMHRLFKLNRYSAQRIAFDSIPDKLTTDAPFTLAARATSDLPVTYSLVSGPASVTGNTVTLAGTPGTVTIRASQAGNDGLDAAPDVERTFRVGNVLGLEAAPAGVRVYPNPAPGSFLVTLPAPGQAKEIRLLNTLGKPVRITCTPTGAGYRVAVTDPLPGLYLLHVRLAGAEWARKVVLR